ncbi:MHS family MFS transporter [Calidifontibacter sp. DB0510]|uniref:MHS family MFS transporter n=1 Tax=Metallococcus carri TaxID=1656884 RepID=A0A967AXK8_9MICO|nr:MFS transporter [Metallococcus carri]NHN54846.1 MHS family MFS transporter [Metallococcus carri]NOP37191.1 MFS transporter [Calidifontibacter sp. DB2511S]
MSTTTSARRTILGASAGNVVEWFDFLLYGLSATIIAKTFFPGDNPSKGLLATFAVYAVAFAARPVGAIFFGRVGDRFGRRPALTASILLMGAATVAIGLLPGRASIGAAAPVLLLVCRLVQGFSAGGEFAGALTFAMEHLRGRRGFWLGVVASSTWIGGSLATLTLLLLHYLGAGPNAWRYGFIAGGLLSLAGLWIRLRADETPAFTQLAESGELSRQPVRDALRNRRRLIVVLVFFAFTSVLGHMATGYLPTHLTVTVGLDPITTLWAVVTLFALIAVLAPYVGHLTDRLGRRPVMIAAAVFGAVALIPAYLLLDYAGTVGLWIALPLFAIATAGVVSAGAVAIPEQWPANARYTGVGLTNQIGLAIFGGTAPLVSDWLVNATGWPASPAVYGVLIAIPAAIVLILWLPETRPTQDADPVDVLVEQTPA